MPFLPTTREELGGETLDFIVVSTDAYVDHPSFGHAIISRLTEAQGFKVGIIAQPKTDEEYLALGEPSKGFLLSGGVVDSMVSNYTVAKKRREADSYSEGGKAGRTPDRALTVHSKNLKRLFPSTPLVIGGIEASLRRTAHYDYWTDRVMPSILQDTGADLLIYGMGEVPLLEILKMVSRGISPDKIREVRGTAYLLDFDGLSKKFKESMKTGGVTFLPSFEETASDKKAFLKAYSVQSKKCEHTSQKPLVQKHGKDYVVVNPPQFPPDTETLDMVYELPYMRTFHPMYKDGVPAIEEVKFSLVSHRGCYGDCAYCALTNHQGKMISARSKASLLREAEMLTKLPGFKGYIHDVGGPSANFRTASCPKQAKAGSCEGKKCIGFSPCKNLVADHSEYLDILREMRKIPGIKKVFIRSGIRYDYLMLDPNREKVLRELCEHHISGQLKVAPEHVSDDVLKIMNKPSFEVYEEFAGLYHKVNKQLGKEQYLVPYLISSHPGSTVQDAIKLAKYLKSINYMPLQVQDFYPTPGTKSTAIYWTGIDPDTMQEVYVAKTPQEKRTQRALMQYGMPRNHEIVREALVGAGMTSLIGNGKNCLIPTIKPVAAKTSSSPRYDEAAKVERLAKGGYGAGSAVNAKSEKGAPRNAASGLAKSKSKSQAKKRVKR